MQRTGGIHKYRERARGSTHYRRTGHGAAFAGERVQNTLDESEGRQRAQLRWRQRWRSCMRSASSGSGGGGSSKHSGGRGRRVRRRLGARASKESRVAHERMEERLRTLFISGGIGRGGSTQ